MTSEGTILLAGILLIVALTVAGGGSTGSTGSGSLPGETLLETILLLSAEESPVWKRPPSDFDSGLIATLIDRGVLSSHPALWAVTRSDAEESP